MSYLAKIKTFIETTIGYKAFLGFTTLVTGGVFLIKEVLTIGKIQLEEEFRLLLKGQYDDIKNLIVIGESLTIIRNGIFLLVI